MRVLVLVLGLAAAGCGRPAPAVDQSPGGRLETAARRTGIVADPRQVSPVGSWAREGDRLCVVPGGDGKFIVGLSIDYGEGQRCAGSGIGEQHDDRLALRFGGCRLDATYDGDRILLPARVPTACDALCTGRATVAALSVERLSSARSEAAMLRSPDGRPLCGGARPD